jgi:hypothetical protein
LNIPTLKAKSRGRKLRACDQCRQLKRACTSTDPCTPCALRKQDCTYRRPYHDRPVPDRHEGEQTNSDGRVVTTLDVSGHELALEALIHNDNSQFLNITDYNVLSPPTEIYPTDTLVIDIDCWNASSNLLGEHILATSIYLRPTQLDIHLLSQFPFLDNFTKATGFVASFACGSKEQRLVVTAESSNPKSLGHTQSAQCHSPRPSAHWAEITPNALTSRNDCDTRANIVKLLPRTHEIVSQIRETVVTKHHHSPIDMT